MATDPLKFYADVHIARAVAEALRRGGVDLILGGDVGLHDATDQKHLSTAHHQGRVMVTQDEDFLNLHHAGTPHSGIAYFRQGCSIGHIVKNLLLLHEVYEAAEMRGRVEFF